MSIAIDLAHLLALLLESLAYGIFFTFFFILIALLVHSPVPYQYYRRVLIPIACLMFALSTSHLIIGFIRAVQAFVDAPDPVAHYRRIAHPLQIAKTSVFVAQTMLGDGVMVWRSYVVFSGNKLILLASAIPLILNLILGAMAIQELRGAPDSDFISNTAPHWVEPYLAITLAINLLCSMAVVYKLHQSTHSIHAFRSVLPLISAIVKSGALYATGVLGVLITFLVDSNGVYPAMDLLVPLVVSIISSDLGALTVLDTDHVSYFSQSFLISQGIVFSLIVLQIHLHLSRHSRNGDVTGNLPTVGTLPRWRNVFPNADLSDSRLDACVIQPSFTARPEDFLEQTSFGSDAHSKEPSSPPYSVPPITRNHPTST